MTKDGLSSDEIFNLLPLFVHENNEPYSFKLVKHSTKKRVNVSYVSNSGTYLGLTQRSGKTLREALLNMLNWLVEFEYYEQDKGNIFQLMINQSEKAKEDEWCSTDVVCDLCSHKWIAVHPTGVEKFECPNCNNMTIRSNS